MQNTPWDEIGTEIEIVDDLSAAMRQANIDFHVSVRQGMYYAFQKGAEELRTYNLETAVAEGFKYIVRDDIPKALGACTDKYSPLQNADAFGFFQDLIDEGYCTLDTIGNFDSGKKVWVLAKLTHKYWQVVPHDKIQMYLLFVNSHDGEQSVLAGVLPIRVWCANMFHQLGGAGLLKFNHTGDIADKVKNVKKLIEEQLSGADNFIHQLQRLAATMATGEQIDVYFRKLFNCPEGKSTKSENKIKKLKELFVLGKGNEDVYVRGTWYAAYNAATEYLSYETGRTQSSRIKSLWFGANKKTVGDAYSLAVEMSRECIPEKQKELDLG